MRVQHPAPTFADCPVYACTLNADPMSGEHDEPDEKGETWHYDDTSGVHWPVDPKPVDVEADVDSSS